MEINPVVIVVLVYFGLGACLLALFDCLTKRIRTKLAQATGETQSRLIASGTYVGSRVSFILFAGAMWLFWPFVFVGALTDKKGSNNG